MLGSTIPVSIIGIRFAMSVDPFWKPEQYSEHPNADLKKSFTDTLSSSRRRYALWSDNLRHRRRNQLYSERDLVSRSIHVFART